MKVETENFAKRAVISMADLAAESGLSLIPGASIPYSVIKKAAGLIQEYNLLKEKQKMEQFVSSIFDNNSLDNKDIDVDDFSKVLKLCLQDIEDEKSEIYGKFFRGLMKNKSLLKDEKQELILVIKELTINDILLLKKLYIHRRYNIGNRNIKHLLKAENIKTNISKNKLLDYLLIDLENDTITNFAESLVKIIFDEFELTPENIGLKEWRKEKVCIISYQLNNSNHAEIAMEIEKLCSNERISTSTIALVNKNIKPVKILYSAGVLLTRQY
jgi:hypothetical protein